MLKIVAVEGVDGVGKTTIAIKLAEALNYRYVKTPGKKYDKIRRKFDTGNRNYYERFGFYLNAVHQTVKEALQNTANTGIVLDRYLLSLKFYHEELIKKDLSKYIKQEYFPRANTVIVLYASDDIRRKRILKRGGDGDFIEYNRTLQNAVQKRMLNTKDTIKIENGFGKSQISTLLEIMEAVQNKEKGKLQYGKEKNY